MGSPVTRIEILGRGIGALVLGTGLYLTLLRWMALGVTPFRYQGF